MRHRHPYRAATRALPNDDRARVADWTGDCTDIDRTPAFISGLVKMRRLLAFLLLAPTCLAVAADYVEHLNLRPLPQSALLASFNFRSNSSLQEFDSQNFRYFPRSLGQILQHAGTKELHLRFNLGRWDAQNWGARPWDGQREGGTGVELWAWLDADTDAE